MDSNKLELERLSKGERKRITAAVIDSLLRVAAGGTIVTTSLLLPGSTIAFAPLAERYLGTLDKRQRRREARRIIAYMRRQQLLKTEPRTGNGMIITNKGRSRAKKRRINHLVIPTPYQWDGQWRIAFFDVPEKYKLARDNFTTQLKQLGFYQIQRSVWIHPFPARPLIEQIVLHYRIERYVTYIETAHIDHHQELKTKFAKLLS